MIDRRAFLTGLAAVAIPVRAGAQPAQKFARIGYLHPGSRETARGPEWLAQALSEHGWEGGRNLAMETRFARGQLERLPRLAEELVGLRVDVILPVLNDAIAAAMRATASIPIVMLGATDPVGVGFVSSLASPGGNVTGTTSNPPEVTGGKALELLKTTVRDTRRVAILLEPDYPGMAAFLREARAAAAGLGLTLEILEIRASADLDVALAALARTRPDALDVLTTGPLLARRGEIIAFALEHRLPTMWPGLALPAEEGGLLTYGFNVGELMRQAAAQVDKILKGANPGTLPVEQPNRYDLVVNVKTARAIGLTIPPAILLRAARVIE